MPTGAVKDEDGVRALSDLGADLGQVRVHRFGADAGQDEGGAGAAGWAYCTEQIGRAVALIAWRPRPAAPVGPNIGQGTLLANPSLILPPDFQRLAPGMLGYR